MAGTKPANKAIRPSEVTNGIQYECARCKVQEAGHSRGYHGDQESLQHKTDAPKVSYVAVVLEVECRKDNTSAQDVAKLSKRPTRPVVRCILDNQAARSLEDLSEV